jgi:hypothetical protein
MRAAFTLALMGFLATASAAQAADCKPISMITQVQMTPLAGYNIDLVPFELNGKQANLLFDTGGSMTQVSSAAAQTLGLVVAAGNIGMYDIRGRLSHDMISVREFSLGTMKGSFGHFPVNPNLDASHPDPWDGILALD